MYVYKTTSRFTSVCKYKLTKMLTFIFPQNIHLAKNNQVTFSNNSGVLVPNQM